MKRLFLFLLCITLIFPAAYSEALLFKQCPDCGWTIRNDDKSINFSRLKFCKDCGVELVDAPQETQTPAPTASPAPTETPAPAVELPSAETKIGDIITFGHYEQDGDLANGQEEIEWLVLDKKDDQILVISQYILDCQPFHTSMIYVSWKNSFLRQWLNDDFFNTAFSEEEQSRIPTVTLSSESNGAWTLSGYETNDKIFLLNETEANDYFPSNHARKGEFTAYAAQLKNAAWGNTSTWWLRTPGAYEGSDVAHFIDDDGIAIYSNGAVSGTDVIALLGVRPAMWISLAESAEEKETVPSATAATPASTAAATLSETLPVIQGKIGETFTFGHYEQDGDLSNGSEPIEWMVLDQKDDQILVISQYGLEPYDINDPNTPISWKDFPIRSWLNEEFLHSAFSVTEQELISLANVSTNEAKTAFTQDMLFLLSYAEADEYFPEDADRIARGTPYYAQTSWVSDEQACFWWLRPLATMLSTPSICLAVMQAFFPNI